ncbi:DinB family protein [Parapedobacter deserti]|uniref:DinB family protein n=1 Tax=Parapedobacter deserti TaxID=1912957 RepID=A0ABV7JLH5_9SPHI
MEIPPGNNVARCLLAQFKISFQLLSYHLDSLSVDECLWQPSKKGIYLKQVNADTWAGTLPESEAYEVGPPNIAWLIWHIDYWWSMVINHSFGNAALNKDEVIWQSSIEKITNRFETLKEEWIERVNSLSSDDLESHRYSRWPIADCPFSDIAAWLNLELMKNAAEIGYIRFLYASREEKVM